MKLFAALVLIFWVSFRCGASGSISSNQPYAWGENLAWLNCYADGTNGLFIGPLFCYGNVYCANAGWINLGNGAPMNGASYSQSVGDFGVNVVDGANLVGYAWGANVGWINFGNNYPPQTSLPKMSMATGQLNGYVWSANCGWINLDSTASGVSYGIVGLDTLSVSLTPSLTITLNGIPGATYQIQYSSGDRPLV